MTAHPPRSLHRTFLALTGAIALATLAAGCAGEGRTTDTSVAPATVRAVPVRTTIVATRDLDEKLELTGTLKPKAQVQVVAEVAARLLTLTKDEGSAVRKGETIATLDCTDYSLAHQRARAALAVTEANLAHANTERDRAEQLIKTGGITDKDRLAAQVQLQLAEAALTQGKVEVAIAAQQVARCEVQAPITGHVSQRHADAGAMLANGSPILTLVDDSVLEFRASVTSADYDKVKLGAAVDVTVDAVPDFATRGVVARIAPIVQERSRSFEVVVRVPGSASLVSGLFARALVQVRAIPGALVVPPSALVRDEAQASEAAAFVIVNGRAERRVVKTGVERADAIQVLDGLKAGDVVVVDPPVSLGNGSQVEVQNGKK
jgi:RND family efflux transporter MFP subunit